MGNNSTKVISDLTRKLGGFSALGREFGVTPWAVQKWYRRGSVPPERVLMLCDLAALHGLEVKPWQIRPDIFPAGIFARR